MEEKVGGKRLGDGESNLLDEFERKAFEAHLNRAMLSRTLSLSHLEPRLALVGPGPGPGCGGFHNVLNKMLDPILATLLPTSMASPSFLPSQVFQSPLQSASLKSPLLIKCNTRSNYEADSTSIRAGNHFSLYTSNPSQTTLNLDDATLRTKQPSQLPFKWDLKHLRLKTLANRIRALSPNNRIKILQILQKDGQLQTTSDFNFLLMALLIAKEHDICFAVHNDLLPSYRVEPDCWTCSIMIRCCCERNHLDEAERVLNTMLENGFRPDVETSTILINSFCKRGRMKKALEIFQLVRGIGTKPTVQMYNCLLKGMCYVGKVEQAFEMLMNMKKKKKEDHWKPDIYSYTTVMDGLCKVGRSDEARELLNEAEVKMGLTPNVVTFNTLFQGYSREGRPLEGISVLKLMKERNCVPDYVSYSTLLHGLLKWNEIKQALRIYKEMERFGFEVDARMMGTLVRRLSRRSWKERGMLEDAYQVFEKMAKRDITIDERTHEVMIQALCAQGRADEAVSTLVLVCAKGRIPSRFCFDVVINELNAQGRLFCASNLFGSAMKLGVIPMEEPLV
ncbi:pentatricopeptide repeat-containing protein [Senna tora]|uniref:Pentatricopeptide repeat-containing protein n=1 Tax=Senna tora TaxID=362788 RepID=A0A834TRV6_9FABA|nr:pentatricopeptide repeat-containing protein [Senna tora]